MNNEQKQIIDDAYKNYCNQVKMEWEDGAINELCEDGFIVEDSNDGKNVNYRLLTQEEFINKCKTDNGFSEKWGLKIEERELNRLERIQLGLKAGWKPKGYVENFEHEDLDGWNIPTRLITITYKNKKIESYE